MDALTEEPTESIEPVSASVSWTKPDERPSANSITPASNSERVERLFRYLTQLFSIDLNIPRQLAEHQNLSPAFQLPVVPELQSEWVVLGSFTENDKPKPWLTVKRPPQIPVPPIPAELRNWVDQSDNPDKEPSARVRTDPNTGAQHTLGELPELQSAFEKWLSELWRPWALRVRPTFAATALYTKLFAINEALSLRGSTIELLWGTGRLIWQASVGPIDYPMILTPLEIRFHEAQAKLEVWPKEQGHELHVFPLLSDVDGMEAKVEPLEAKRKNCQNQVSDPRNPVEVSEFLKSLANILHPKGALFTEKGLPPISQEPRAVLDQTIFLRPVSQHLWVQDFKEIIRNLQQTGIVPSFIERLVCDLESDGKGAVSVVLNSPHDSRARRYVEPLFPLPVNDEQLSILDAAENSAGVVVQGPPGTGKSHTIANLISHYLAQGLRILVTSHTEKALQVLRDKLPQEIRQLSVSVLTSDAESKRELQDSVRTIHSRLGDHSSSQYSTKVKHLLGELDGIKERRRTLYHQLVEIEENEHRTFEFGAFSGNPLELAKKLGETSAIDGWLKDLVSNTQRLESSEDELRGVYVFLENESPEFIDALLFALPDEDQILTSDEFTHLVDEEEDYERLLKELAPSTALGGTSAEINVLVELRGHLEKLSKGLTGRTEAWVSKLTVEVQADPVTAERWTDFVQKFDNEFKRLEHADQERIGHLVAVETKGIALLESISSIERLVSRHKSHQRLSWLKCIHLPGPVRRLLSAARIDSKPITHMHHLPPLLAELRLRLGLENLAQYHSFLATRVGAPPVAAASQEEGIKFYRQVRDHLDFTVVSSRVIADKILELAKRLRMPIQQPYLSMQEKVSSILRSVTAKLAEAKLAACRSRVLETEIYLKRLATGGSPHPCVARMLTALDARDRETWASELATVATYRDEAIKAKDVRPHLLFLNESFPRTLAWLRAQLKERADIRAYSRERWERAINHAQAAAFLDEFTKGTSPQDLRNQLLELQKESEDTKASMIAAMAWQKQLSRITAPERQALVAWHQAVQDLGKRMGKKEYVERKDRAVRKAMSEAVTAVPVWIMPLHRVVESFYPARPGQFDVVIFDESSQCDLRALSVLYRGKKAIIVGDDKQVSPENTGVDRQKVHTLIDHYLADIPYKERFSLDDSLYNVATLRLPQTVMLREHFRCVPEIIEFSNQNFYKNPAVRDSGLIPMRLPTPAERIPEPLKSVFVQGERENNVNFAEAEAIVIKLKELIANPLYAKKTFGVITLMANPAQAEVIQKLMFTAIPEAEIRERKIQVGDPKYFQGDERHVILLSMVVGGPGDSFAALTKASDERRFNVAASRAREQMWLFHSVKASEIHNDSCMRHKLLAFFNRANVEVPKSPSGRPMNEFEKAVAKRIMARGFEVIPQFPAPGSGIMRYIDLVVMGKSARLAVECDGDRWHGRDQWEADHKRENQLRRAGWEFWRVRGSAFYRDPEKALESLWTKLMELGIQPTK